MEKRLNSNATAPWTKPRLEAIDMAWTAGSSNGSQDSDGTGLGGSGGEGGPEGKNAS